MINTTESILLAVNKAISEGMTELYLNGYTLHAETILELEKQGYSVKEGVIYL